MTVVVAYVDESNKKIIMGADICIVYGSMEFEKVSDKIKVFKVTTSSSEGKKKRKLKAVKEVAEKVTTEEMVLGFAGTWAVIQQIMYNLEVPEYVGQDLVGYMVRDVAPAIKDLADLGETEPLSVMVGFKGRLFEIDEQFSVTENFKNYSAIGSGANHAKASLYAQRDSSLSPTEKVTEALECAANFIINVKAPFTYHTIYS